MSELILSSSNALPVPLPKEELTFREGTLDDITFIDELQKLYHNQLGFMPTMWLEGKIAAKHILIAEIDGLKVGYIIAQDKYMKREELGIVYQIAVRPGKQRAFIGAALLKAQFDRSAHGCRLYCCWCAQDIEANQFWESMGFVQLAYRNGAEKKGKNGEPRVHIFWEKKIRGHNDTCHWWYPSKTDQGAMRADRLALPIPPGVDWRDLKPIELPIEGAGMNEGMKKLEGDCPQSPSERSGGRPPSMKIPQPIRQRAHFGPPGMIIPPAPVVATVEPVVEKPKREKKPKQKIDPKFIAASRELRDRYLEEVNEHGYKLESAGKYELTRAVAHPSPTAMLEAA